MKRGLALGFLLLAVSTPDGAIARVDPECSTAAVTTSITGVVENRRGEPLAGMRVELYRANSASSLPDVAHTDAQGVYRVCVSTGHDTYDVHVKDVSTAPRYASVNQPYTTYSNLTAPADFTPESGFPMLFMTNLMITPNEISTVAGSVPVEWVVRSKAPASTVMELTLGHRKDADGNDPVVVMDADGIEGGGPQAGGWNRWRYTETIEQDTPDKLNFASVAGRDGQTFVTQMDRQPYVFDNMPPLFGAGRPTTLTACGGNLGIHGFSPESPPGTTNPWPVVTHGVCDPMVDGARAGLDPFALRGKICRDEALQVDCAPISPILNTHTIGWFPSATMEPGDYYIQWTAVDLAGNATSNPRGFRLTITDRGGQTPLFSSPRPGNSSGGTQGVIVGSSLTTPSSLPYVGFTVRDGDGQTDMIPGSLVVKVFYGDERTLEYEYDAFKGANEYDPITKRGGGIFDLSNGQFRAGGYSLQYRAPGRYVASAAITDYGGNTATFTWNWVLVAAV